jgi:hypothetical protein
MLHIRVIGEDEAWDMPVEYSDLSDARADAKQRVTPATPRVDIVDDRGRVVDSLTWLTR